MSAPFRPTVAAISAVCCGQISRRTVDKKQYARERSSTLCIACLLSVFERMSYTPLAFARFAFIRLRLFRIRSEKCTMTSSAGRGRVRGRRWGRYGPAKDKGRGTGGANRTRRRPGQSHNVEICAGSTRSAREQQVSPGWRTVRAHGRPAWTAPPHGAPARSGGHDVVTVRRLHHTIQPRAPMVPPAPLLRLSATWTCSLSRCRGHGAGARRSGRAGPATVATPTHDHRRRRGRGPAANLAGAGRAPACRDVHPLADTAVVAHAALPRGCQGQLQLSEHVARIHQPRGHARLHGARHPLRCRARCRRSDAAR